MASGEMYQDVGSDLTVFCFVFVAKLGIAYLNS